MIRKTTPFGASLGAGAAIVALALVVHVSNMSEVRSVTDAVFGIPSAQAKERGAQGWGTPQRLATSELAIVTGSGKRHDFSVEVARTAEEQAIGMMFRQAVPEDTGMLFLFPSPRPASFWMRNTYVPLDLIFIRKDGRIESILPNARPESLDLLQSNGPVIAVLELAGGLSERLGLSAGDRVLHKDLPQG